MMHSGAILDIPNGMTRVSCIVAPDSRPDRRESTLAAPGKISGRAEKFPPHVLVVDDEPLIRWSVAESLSDAGVDVEQASDAASALHAVTTTALPFDAVVLDLRLPDMDDLSLLGTLHQLMPHATLVLMTAFGTPEVVADARAMGATILNKPFELDELRRLVLGREADAA
jgi:DNA-binding NtrC family response regulator